MSAVWRYFNIRHKDRRWNGGGEAAVNISLLYCLDLTSIYCRSHYFPQSCVVIKVPSSLLHVAFRYLFSAALRPHRHFRHSCELKVNFSFVNRYYSYILSKSQLLTLGYVNTCVLSLLHRFSSFQPSFIRGVRLHGRVASP